MHFGVVGLVAVVLFSFTAAHADTITINPSSVGGPNKTFSVSSMDLSYSSIVNQSLSDGSFTESGTAIITQLNGANGALKGTGLNNNYVLSAAFSATGFAQPIGPGTFQATFQSFDVRLYANATTLIGQSTGLLPNTNSATITFDSATHATGTFDVAFGFTPVGSFFRSRIVGGTLEGSVDSNTIFAGSGALTSIHTGTGELTFQTATGVSQGLLVAGDSSVGSVGGAVIVNPEPSSVLLFASGLAGFAAVRARRRKG